MDSNNRYDLPYDVYAEPYGIAEEPPIDACLDCSRPDAPAHAKSNRSWIAAHPEPSPSRPEVIRRILGQALGKLADAGSIPAENLNASKARKAK
jgi:hypothetical protein